MNEVICSFRFHAGMHERFKSKTQVTVQEIINLRDELILEAKTIDSLLSNKKTGDGYYLKRIPQNLAFRFGFIMIAIVEHTKIAGIDESVRLAISNQFRREVLKICHCNELNNYLRRSINDEYKKHLTGESELLKTYNRAITLCDSIISFLQPNDAAA